MRFLIVDDDAIAVKQLEVLVRNLSPDYGVDTTVDVDEAIELAKKNVYDGAFLDVEMPKLNGIALAKQLRNIQSNLNIVFVTGNEQYAIDAFKLHVEGYILKPATLELVEKEINYIKGQNNELDKPSIITFGGFDMIVNGEIVNFHRGKAKELLAILVDKRGASISSAQGCALLWPEALDDDSLKSHYRTIIATLKKSLEEVGLEDIIVKGHNSLSLDVDKVSCDVYEFLDGNPAFINSFTGEYMPDYEWAETTLVRLEDLAYRYEEATQRGERAMYKFLERRNITRVEYEKNCRVLFCDTGEVVYAHSTDISPSGMGILLDGAISNLIGREVFVVAPTMIVYAEIVRMSPGKDGYTFVGIKAKEINSIGDTVDTLSKLA